MKTINFIYIRTVLHVLGRTAVAHAMAKNTALRVMIGTIQVTGRTNLNRNT